MKRLLLSLRHPDRNLLIILALSLFAWAPLLTPAYFFQAHDARHSIFYLVEFDQTLRDGYFWPRWAPDFAFGYGYPLFNIYAPLAIYAAEVLHLLGLGFVAAVKAVYALATIGAGLAMYLFVRHLPAPGEGRVFGRKAGLLAAVVYMYVPFHLVEIFVRSAYSEFVALALLPLVLYAFTELVTMPSLRRLALAGLVYGVLALTHHTSFFTFTPFLVVYILYLLAGIWRDKGAGHALRTALFTVGSGVLGLALSAIYLLPMLAELRYVKIEQWTAYNYDYGQHFVYFSQLLSPDWGYGYSGPGLNDGMSFQLGAVALVLVIFGGWLALTRRDARSGSHGRHGPHPRIDLFFLASTAIIVWLMSPAAQFARRPGSRPGLRDRDSRGGLIP
ncbi:MAG: 6-pyruvoyl-tetrahydropterin synthase-related protein [Anaerolineae bacterium]